MPKHDEEASHANGDLQQEIAPDNNEEWTLVVRRKSSSKKIQKTKSEPTPPKKIQKAKSEPTPTEKPRSALKGKQKIFYLESKSGRNYIVDSGASFHLVFGVELTDHEASTIVALDEPIPIQTANGEVQRHENARSSLGISRSECGLTSYQTLWLSYP